MAELCNSWLLCSMALWLVPFCEPIKVSQIFLVRPSWTRPTVDSAYCGLGLLWTRPTVLCDIHWEPCIEGILQTHYLMGLYCNSWQLYQWFTSNSRSRMSSKFLINGENFAKVWWCGICTELNYWTTPSWALPLNRTSALSSQISPTSGHASRVSCSVL